MVCIYCGSGTQVVNSRLQRRSNQVWRRRKCLVCSSTFSSLEAADLLLSLSYRTSQNALHPFSRDILFISIYESCKHRKNAVSDANALTATILGRLRPYMKDAVIERQDVINTTQQILKRFDRAAATFYAAYHPLN